MKNGLGLNFRKCKLSDVDFIYNINKRTVFTHFQQKVWTRKEFLNNDFRDFYHDIVIVSRGKRRIGYYRLDEHKNYLFISAIVLSPAYHNKGIGKFLMSYFEILGYQKIVLQVWKNNPAVSFYKKLGYRVVDQKKYKYVMEKKIK